MTALQSPRRGPDVEAPPSVGTDRSPARTYLSVERLRKLADHAALLRLQADRCRLAHMRAASLLSERAGS